MFFIIKNGLITMSGKVGFVLKEKKHVYVKPFVRRCTYSVSQLASVATISHLTSSVSRSIVKNVISNMGLFLGLPDTCTT